MQRVLYLLQMPFTPLLRVSPGAEKINKKAHFQLLLSESSSGKLHSELVGETAWWVTQSTKPGQWSWPCTPWGLAQGDVLLARCVVVQEGYAIWTDVTSSQPLNSAIRKPIGAADYQGHECSVLARQGFSRVQIPELSQIKMQLFWKEGIKKNKYRWYCVLLQTP